MVNQDTIHVRAMALPLSAILGLALYPFAVLITAAFAPSLSLSAPLSVSLSVSLCVSLFRKEFKDPKGSKTIPRIQRISDGPQRISSGSQGSQSIERGSKRDPKDFRRIPRLSQDSDVGDGESGAKPKAFCVSQILQRWRPRALFH